MKQTNVEEDDPMTELIYRPALCAAAAGAFIFLMTSLGSALVFFFKSFSPRIHCVILGLTGGIMIAASFWSLLEPSIEASLARGEPAWLAASVGVAAGAAFLALTDLISGKLDRKRSRDRSGLLMLSLTVHNVPEGLAVGVAFGLLRTQPDAGALAAAFSVAIGIGIQNFPEGAAVSLPMRRAGATPKKSFLMGVLSGAVEPVAALAGVMLVSLSGAVLPWLLAFAAGAMLFVAAGEMIPKACELGRTGALAGFTAGFILMMALDVAL